MRRIRSGLPAALLLAWAAALTSHAAEESAAPAAEAKPPLEEFVSGRAVRPDLHVAVVREPIKAERLDTQTYGNLWPWTAARAGGFSTVCLRRCEMAGPACWNRCAYANPDLPENDRREGRAAPGGGESEDDDQILVSNSCGFVRTTYRSVRLLRSVEGAASGAPLSEVRVYSRMGEWCRMKRAIADAGSGNRHRGMLLGNWAGAWYALGDFDLYRESGGTEFVLPSVFSPDEQEEIADLLKPLAPDDRVCRRSDDLHVGQWKELQASAYVMRGESRTDWLCVTHGLPLPRVLPALQRLRRTWE